MIKRSSLRFPITLAIILLVLIVVLTVIWIIGLGITGQWVLLTIGTIGFVAVLAGFVIHMIIVIKEVRLNQRQANFIDAVTHELKSPIASIKLYLQTLDMRDVSQEQQRKFHQFMLEDVQRLDGLIDHLLRAARLNADEHPISAAMIRLDSLLETTVSEINRRYTLKPEQIRIESIPCLVRGNPNDLEIVVKNLIDNAVKYGGNPCQVLIQTTVRGNKVLLRISDNGPGIGYELRRKVFERFVRGGTELERTSKGTGLGLYLVRQLLLRMSGKISVTGRGPLKGATFEAELVGTKLEEGETNQTETQVVLQNR